MTRFRCAIDEFAGGQAWLFSDYTLIIRFSGTGELITTVEKTEVYLWMIPASRRARLYDAPSGQVKRSDR